MSPRGPWKNVECKECGKPFEVSERRLALGRGKFCSRSCGAKANQKAHGHTTKTKQSSTYISWAAMIQRCTNPNTPAYHLYGGSGITVCDEWRGSFEAFLADMGERPHGRSLDRIDGSKGYSPENCRWSTRKEQSANISTNKVIDYMGEQMIAPEIARRLGINLSTLRYRIRKNWPQSEWGKTADGTIIERRRST